MAKEKTKKKYFSPEQQVVVEAEDTKQAEVKIKKVTSNKK